MGATPGNQDGKKKADIQRNNPGFTIFFSMIINLPKTIDLGNGYLSNHKLLMRPKLSRLDIIFFKSSWIPASAGMTTKNHAFLMFVSPAKAGVQFRRSYETAASFLAQPVSLFHHALIPDNFAGLPGASIDHTHNLRPDETQGI